MTFCRSGTDCLIVSVCARRLLPVFPKLGIISSSLPAAVSSTSGTPGSGRFKTQVFPLHDTTDTCETGCPRPSPRCHLHRSVSSRLHDPRRDAQNGRIGAVDGGGRGNLRLPSRDERAVDTHTEVVRVYTSSCVWASPSTSFLSLPRRAPCPSSPSPCNASSTANAPIQVNSFKTPTFAIVAALGLLVSRWDASERLLPLIASRPVARKPY
ncbi:hypothetical protein R3P38DRAFT_3230638 [Favolaschia claudopus]|uniref:Uncharacterized protein n=1 Tax=Favolaschia claudopus TaxID=2862362 RepID=A0AAV9ZMG2_9AGAR